MADAPNYFEMSDDDIANMSSPTVSAEPAADTPPAGEGADTIEAAQAADSVVSAEGNDTLDGGNGNDTVAAVEGADTVEGGNAADTIEAASGADTIEAGAADPAITAKVDKDPKDPADPAGSAAEKVALPTPEEATAFFTKVMAPFKANGKTVQLKSPEEVIQLMQMGANYTRKMQDIQPHRKVLLMLQNNDLLDEGKLSYLIDLDKKDPEAIKKLVKDSGIDPLEIDTSVEPAYRAGNHRVTDEEAGFRAALDEVTSSPAGRETVQLINEHWDQTSKEALWGNPQIVSIIHAQRENGVYAMIVEEMDRQKLLGKIPVNTPFLQAYHTVGDQLAAAKAFEGIEGAGTDPNHQETPASAKQEPVAVAVRAAAPKSLVKNGDEASAASPTRTTTRVAEKFVNPLAMSDEDFMKLEPFKARV